MASPHRPDTGPDLFGLALAEELGVNPDQVLHGSVRVDVLDDDEVQVRWTGAATITREALDRAFSKSGVRVVPAE